MHEPQPACDSVQAAKQPVIPPGQTRIHNRKYLGSKYRLLPFLLEIILQQTGRIGTFIDGFAGTGVVGCAFLPYARKVIANDLLYANYVILHTYLNSPAATVSAARINRLLLELNSLPGREGYVFRHFAGSYFTGENARLIDAVRERIEELALRGECTPQEKMMLLASLLLAVDKIANTVGQYDAFLKNIACSGDAAAGRHLVDSNVHKRLSLKMPACEAYSGHEVYCEDLNSLLSRLGGDVLYLDPPYNSRQYVDCYHVLENIARWQKPELSGKTQKFAREHLKSAYSRKLKAPAAFRELIAKAKVSHIFLSYNSEGIIPDEFLLEVLRQKGQVEIFEQPYKIFGNGAGVSRKRKITERLFHCRVRED